MLLVMETRNEGEVESNVVYDFLEPNPPTAEIHIKLKYDLGFNFHKYGYILLL
jgi:hypothetical protein